jgi:hypothetical protein
MASGVETMNVFALLDGDEGDEDPQQLAKAATKVAAAVKKEAPKPAEVKPGEWRAKWPRLQ